MDGGVDGGADGYDLLGPEGRRAALSVGMTQAEVKKVRGDCVRDDVIKLCAGCHTLRGHHDQKVCCHPHSWGQPHS